MAISQMTQKAADRIFKGRPLEELKNNLVQIFRDYGITEKTIEKIKEEFGAYSYLLDRETGKLSEKGKKSMEYWKHRFGDYIKEITFVNRIIDD